MLRRIFVLSALFLYLCANAYADTITLKSGRQVEGRIINKSDSIVSVDLGDKVEVYMLSEVASISGENTSAAAPAAEYPVPAQSMGQENDTSNAGFLKSSSPRMSREQAAMAAGVMGIIVIIALILSLVFYIYSSLCLYFIAKKTNQELCWMAWIPVASLLLMLNIAQIKYRWLLLILAAPIPIVGYLVMIAATLFIWYKIIIARNKPAWLIILMIVPIANLVVMGYLAFSN